MEQIWNHENLNRVRTSINIFYKTISNIFYKSLCISNKIQSLFKCIYSKFFYNFWYCKLKVCSLCKYTMLTFKYDIACRFGLLFLFYATVYYTPFPIGHNKDIPAKGRYLFLLETLTILAFNYSSSSFFSPVKLPKKTFCDIVLSHRAFL